MKVLVHFEHDGGAIKRGSLSALRFARDVAEQTGGAVTGLVLGSDAGDAASDAARYVPVLVADDTALKPAIAGPHARVIADAVTSGGFDVVVGAATSAGKDVLGRVGGLLGGFMASDVAVMKALNEAAVSYLVILTKIDKLKPAALARLMSECESALKAHVAAYPLALATSARSGEGIAELRAHLGALAGAAAIH